MRRRLCASMFALSLMLIPGVAYAHVIVTPSQAGVAEELVFNVSVPNEEQVPVTNVKLLIPDGVTSVTPTTKDGWTVTTTSNGDGKDPETTTVNWAGNIPVGQRQDFSFSAQVPGKATELDWKAYQTYADGTVVHWDQKPAGSDDATGNAGPYSVTQVVNDLTGSSSNKSSANYALIGSYVLSALALIIAAWALVAKKK